MSIWEYLCIGFWMWVMMRVTIGRGAVLELVVALLFWPLVAAAAVVIALACGAAWIREQIGKWWRK